MPDIRDGTVGMISYKHLCCFSVPYQHNRKNKSSRNLGLKVKQRQEISQLETVATPIHSSWIFAQKDIGSFIHCTKKLIDLWSENLLNLDILQFGCLYVARGELVSAPPL